MAKKFNWKIFDIILVVVLAIVTLTTCLILYFVKDSQDYKNSYTGYDGYIWCGTKRLNKLSNEKVADDDAFEHTLEVAGTMANYFDGEYADLSNNYIALLSNYQKYSKTAIFSELKIKSIAVFAKDNGFLDIGIANVEDVVNSRTSQTPLSVKNVGTFQVTSGQTKIEFEEPVFIDTNETIVLGANGSASLYYAKNIPVDDEAGNFTLIDGQKHEKLLQNTGGQKYDDTLAVEVKVITVEEKPIFENLKENVQNDMGGLSSMEDMVGNDYWGPYIYGYINGNAFENKTITKISVPVQNLEKKNGELPYLDMYIIPTYKENGVSPLPDSNEVLNKRRSPEVLTQNKVERLRIKSEQEYEQKLAKLTQTDDTHRYGWVDFDCHYVIPDGYTLAFGGPAGGIYWLCADYREDKTGVVNTTGIGNIPYYNQLRYIGAIGKKSVNAGEANYSGFLEFHRMFFDCYYEQIWSVEQQIEKINNLEYEAAKIGKLRELLGGKYVSILGDSISTYENYSNEYETQNSDIKNNGIWGNDPNDHNYRGNKMFYFDDVTGIYDDKNTPEVEKRNFKETLGVPTVHDTWWMSTIERANMKLCVNNSFSGGLITDNLTIKRSEQLHDNTKYSDFKNEKNLGQEQDIYPDIVAIYMGINDFNASGNVEPDTFYTIYKKIVLNIFKTYFLDSPNLKVFVFTIPPSSSTGSKWSSNIADENIYRQNLEKFNNKIRQIAEEIEYVELVDLFNYCNMTRMEMRAYANDYLHPNSEGMKMISDCFIDALYKSYVKEN